MQTKAFELAGIEIETGFAAKETGNRFIISESEKPSPYSFLTNNCSQHVGIIALAGGVFTRRFNSKVSDFNGQGYFLIISIIKICEYGILNRG